MVDTGFFFHRKLPEQSCLKLNRRLVHGTLDRDYDLCTVDREEDPCTLYREEDPCTLDREEDPCTLDREEDPLYFKCQNKVFFHCSDPVILFYTLLTKKKLNFSRIAPQNSRFYFAHPPHLSTAGFWTDICRRRERFFLFLWYLLHGFYSLCGWI